MYPSKILHLTEFFYTTSGDKYEVCFHPKTKKVSGDMTGELWEVVPVCRALSR